VILSDLDHGKTVEVNLGGHVVLRLRENPTTGHQWRIESANGLKLANDHFDAAGSAIGAAGVREFNFYTTKVGSYELRLKNRREWEGEGSVIGYFSVMIIVK